MPKLTIEFAPEVIEALEDAADRKLLSLPEYIEALLMREILGEDAEGGI